MRIWSPRGNSAETSFARRYGQRIVANYHDNHNAFSFDARLSISLARAFQHVSFSLLPGDYSGCDHGRRDNWTVNPAFDILIHEIVWKVSPLLSPLLCAIRSRRYSIAVREDPRSDPFTAIALNVSRVAYSFNARVREILKSYLKHTSYLRISYFMPLPPERISERSSTIIYLPNHRRHHLKIDRRSLYRGISYVSSNYVLPGRVTSL